MNALKLPHDSHLRYLPMVYFLPEAYITCCPTLRKLPRNLREIMQSPELIAIIKSEQFINEIADATSALAFPHFGFRGWKEDYTGFCPVWKLSYSLPLWCRLVEEVTGWGLTALLSRPFEEDVPLFESDYVKEVMAIVVKRGIVEQNWQPILDVVKKLPCEEDFEIRRSRVRIYFERKWYRTRTKIKIVSLEKCLADPTHLLHRKAVNTNDISVDVESADYWERFKARLSERDKEILVMRANGYPYEEIAEELGYKNHSGVLKRMRHIRAVYEKYEEEQE